LATTSTGASKAVHFQFDRQFQEAIIRLLFQDQEFALGSLDKLNPDYFEEPHHRWAAKTIYWSHKTLGLPPDRSLMLNEATKAVQAGIIKEHEVALTTKLLKRLKDPVANKTYLVAEVQSFCKAQAWKAAILAAVDEDIPGRDFGALEKRMMETAEINFSSDGGHGDFYWETYKKRQKARENGTGFSVPTGTKLDAYMKHGGLPSKVVAVVLAGTGRGKTNWLIDRVAVALSEVEDLQAVYYTLELPSDMISERLDARFSDIPMQLLGTGGKAYREKMEELGDMLAGRLVVKEFAMGTVTAHSFRAHLRGLERAAFYPKLIVVDYAELMLPTIITTDDNVNQGRIYQDLQGLGRAANALIWTANQGNRDSMKEDVETTTLAHTGGSIKKVQLADYVVSLSQTMEEKKNNRMRASVEKSRLGASGVEIPLKVDHSKGKFSDG
jgi:replicative DNA helicase